MPFLSSNEQCQSSEGTTESNHNSFPVPFQFPCVMSDDNGVCGGMKDDTAARLLESTIFYAVTRRLYRQRHSQLDVYDYLRSDPHAD